LLRTGIIGGGHNYFIDTAGLDTAVQTVSASAVAYKPPTQVVPAKSAYAVWRSTAGCLATQVDSTGVALLLAPLRNDTDAEVDSLVVTYQMTSTASPENLKGHRVYWSSSGVPGTWRPLGDRMNHPPGARVPVTLFATGLAWPAGATGFLLWADDNGVGTDASYSLDDLSFTPAFGPMVAITSPVSGGPVGLEFELQAEARSQGASVVDVTYLYGAGHTRLAARTTPPYRVALSGLAPGPHVLTAVARDSLNRMATSMPVVVTASAGSGPLLRGPYLQKAGPDRMTVRWRGSNSVPGRVCFGTSTNQLQRMVVEGLAPPYPYDHEVTLTGLAPATTYYYNIGSSRDLLAGGADCTFTTPPLPGTWKETLVWVLGDAQYGSSGAQQLAVRQAFFAWMGDRALDFVFQLGDNASDFGTDDDYQAALFDIFPSLLRRVPFWSSVGNHDVENTAIPSDVHAYFRIYSPPTAAECGGVPSGTKHYYSFDHANIHFIALDSMTASRSPSGPMATWLRMDLAATTADWIVCSFHHPPYSKGTHDSDEDPAQTEMRQNILPILEEGGVDLVLSGHSHVYERSHLLDGHYGVSSTFEPAMILDAGGGRPEESGAYLKPLTGARAHSGTVYVVSGSASENSGGALDHPAHVVSLNAMGTVGLAFSGPRMDVTFIRADGTTPDHFTIQKQDNPGARGGGGLLGVGSNDPGLPAPDTDADGTPDAVELLFATDPLVPDQYELSIHTNPPTGEAVLTFGSATGRTYRVVSSEDLLAWAPCSSALPGTGSSLTWRDERTQGDPPRVRRCFYRVEVTLDP